MYQVPPYAIDPIGVRIQPEGSPNTNCALKNKGVGETLQSGRREKLVKWSGLKESRKVSGLSHISCRGSPPQNDHNDEHGMQMILYDTIPTKEREREGEGWLPMFYGR